MAKPLVEMMDELARPFETEEERRHRWAENYDDQNGSNKLKQVHKETREERRKIRERERYVKSTVDLVVDETAIKRQNVQEGAKMLRGEAGGMLTVAEKRAHRLAEEEARLHTEIAKATKAKDVARIKKELLIEKRAMDGIERTLEAERAKKIADGESDVLVYFKSLTRIYKKYDPDLLEDPDYIKNKLKEYEGYENKLIKMLKAEYRKSDQDREKENATTQVDSLISVLATRIQTAWRAKAARDFMKTVKKAQKKAKHKAKKEKSGKKKEKKEKKMKKERKKEMRLSMDECGEQSAELDESRTKRTSMEADSSKVKGEMFGGSAWSGGDGNTHVMGANGEGRSADVEYALYTFSDPTNKLPESVWICNVERDTQITLKGKQAGSFKRKTVWSWKWQEIDSVMAVQDRVATENMDMLVIKQKDGDGEGADVFRFECEDSLKVRNALLTGVSAHHCRDLSYDTSKYDCAQTIEDPYSLPTKSGETAPRQKSRQHQTAGSSAICALCSSKYFSKTGTSTICSHCRNSDPSPNRSAASSSTKKSIYAKSCNATCKHCNSKYFSQSGKSSVCTNCRGEHSTSGSHNNKLTKMKCSKCTKAYYSKSGKSIWCPGCREDAVNVPSPTSVSAGLTMHWGDDEAGSFTEWHDRDVEMESAAALEMSWSDGDELEPADEVQPKVGTKRDAEKRQNEEAELKAKLNADLEAEEQARVAAIEMSRKEAEEEARYAAIELARKEAKDGARRKREAERRKAAEEAREEEARCAAIELARKEAKDGARRKREAERRKAAEDAREEAELKAESQRKERNERKERKAKEEAERKSQLAAADQVRSVAAETVRRYAEDDMLREREVNARMAAEQAALGRTVSDDITLVSIHGWLGSINAALTKYGGALSEYGYDNCGLLLHADEEDLHEALDSIPDLKKPHRKLIVKAVLVIKTTCSNCGCKGQALTEHLKTGRMYCGSCVSNQPDVQKTAGSAPAQLRQKKSAPPPPKFRQNKSSLPPSQVKLGQIVQAKWGEDKWYPAKIVSHFGDGTADGTMYKVKEHPSGDDVHSEVWSVSRAEIFVPSESELEQLHRTSKKQKKKQPLDRGNSFFL
jgi:hypothetical protein